jgi:hypothetical protein
MPTRSIAVPATVYDRVREAAAAEGATVEQLATKALERDLARRWLDRIGREGDLRRGNMADAESRRSSSGRCVSLGPPVVKLVVAT